MHFIHQTNNKNLKTEFKKTEIQRKACDLMQSNFMHILCVGGSRSGKTFILVRQIFIRAFKVPLSRHVILRLNFAHIRASIWMETIPDVIRKCFPDMKKDKDYFENRVDWFIRLWNGSEIWIAGLDEGQRTEKILGKEYSTMYFNECSNIPYASINIGITRLAQKNALKKMAFYDENPPTKKHWSYRLFIQGFDPANSDNATKKDHEKYAHIFMNPADNIENVDENYMQILDGLPTRAKIRFKLGEFQDDIEGALWDYEMIDSSYLAIDEEIEPFEIIVVAIDPAVTENKNSDETGICVVAKSENFFYVLDDISGIYSPAGWATAACNAYEFHFANLIIGEVNNGGDLVKSNIKNKNPNVKFVNVRATVGKQKRFEPISGLYEQKKVKHLKKFQKLEDQMTGWVPSNPSYSPDRLDALCWGLTYLSAGSGMVKIF